ncbi:unnamed protein product [Trifolium pratense]|uniref:Uncharacterized protein n=1 Tax=Trifolium pratense TaxID=57577 RepID=A0ACB0JLZ5_TRIPR|nr:unnamed protein product [Trifolium pratense]
MPDIINCTQRQSNLAKIPAREILDLKMNFIEYLRISKDMGFQDFHLRYNIIKVCLWEMYSKLKLTKRPILERNLEKKMNLVKAGYAVVY